MIHNSLIIPNAEPFYFAGGSTGCVLVHGFTGTPREMRGLGEFLNQQGLTVLGVRLAGHATQPKDMIRTRWRDWVASVEDGVHQLQNSCEEIYLGGLSMGGILSLVAGAYLPIDGIVAMSTPYALPDDWRLKIAKPLSLIVPWIDKEKSDTKNEQAIQTHIDYPKYPSRSLAELYDLTKVLHQSLQQVRKPTLLINSKSDHTVSLDQATKIQHSLQNAPEIERVVVERSGHVITEDVEREIVFQSVLAFIQKHTKRIR